jgi:hypothetical protein
MTETVTVLRDDLQTMMAYLASGPWTPAEKPEVAGAWKRLTEAKDAGLEAAEALQAVQVPPSLPPLPAARRRPAGGVEPDMPVIAATRRRAELERLTAMGVRVRITNPAYPDSGWTGHIIGLMDQPSILIEMDDGRRHACPQAFAVQELPALPAAEAYEGYYPEAEGRRGCDCGPGERCFECATDEEAAAAIPPRVDDGSPF